jgi:hypothetical protein
VPAYHAGARYDGARTLTPEDQSRFTYRNGCFELVLFFVNPRSAEVRDVRVGLARFALFNEEGMVGLLTAFGDSIDWGPTPFATWSCSAAGPVLPTQAEMEAVDTLLVLLVDAGSRLIHAVREVSLTLDIGKQLCQGVHAQDALFQEPDGYSRAVGRL